MKKVFLIIVLVFIGKMIWAQQSGNELVQQMNKSITIYSTDNASLFAFLEPIGTLEQKISESTFQRIKLADIEHVKVEATSEGGQVTITCAESTKCINLIKKDMSSSFLPANTFFFNDAAIANSFAKSMLALIDKYVTDKTQVKSELLKEAEKATPEKQVVKTEPVKKEISQSKNLQIGEDETDPVEPAAKTNTSNKKSVKKEVEEEDEAIEKSNKTRSKKQIEKNEDEEDADKQRGNSTHDNPMNQANVVEVVDPLCKQLMNIIKAGKNSSFKEIEGVETNATAKINESKLKLKGAKRSYLSWFKKQRAFIAEFKTLTDHDLIIEEFQQLQTQLEDCLEAGWEDIDHSGDEMYANATEELKDVEYKNVNDSSMPSFRIMIGTSEKNKYTLFVRIQ